MAKKTKSTSASKKMAIGAGLAAAGASAYYFLGPKGKTHQRKVKAFAGKMEKEIEEKIKKGMNSKEGKAVVKKLKKVVKKSTRR